MSSTEKPDWVIEAKEEAEENKPLLIEAVHDAEAEKTAFYHPENADKGWYLTADDVWVLERGAMR